MTKQPAVYILASKPRGTLYTGVTSDLVKRVWQYKEGVAAGFTKKYQISNLVYYELHADMINAISREKQLKKWYRAWKIRLIEEHNSEWKDLWPEILGVKMDSRLRGNDKTVDIKSIIIRMKCCSNQR